MADITLGTLDAKLTAVQGITVDTRDELRKLNGTVDEHSTAITRIEAEMVTKDDCSAIQNANRDTWRRYLVAVATGVTLFVLFELVPRLAGGG